jgi:hypothetical protein
MANDMSFLFGKMNIGHGTLLLALSWSCFAICQTPGHVLLLHQVMHFELEFT